MIKGKDIRVYEGSSPTEIAYSKSCSVIVTSEVKEVSSPISARARTYIAGRTGWEVIVSKLLTSMKYDLLRVGNTYTLTFGVVDSDDQLSGTAICTEVQVVGSIGNLAQCSIKFLGSGELI